MPFQKITLLYNWAGVGAAVKALLKQTERKKGLETA